MRFWPTAKQAGLRMRIFGVDTRAPMVHSVVVPAGMARWPRGVTQMIDFEKTRQAILKYQAGHTEISKEWAIADTYESICREVISGRLQRFDEHDVDAFSASFTGWCKYHGLLAEHGTE